MNKKKKKRLRLAPPIKPLTPWRLKLHEIIFEADTKSGKFFDIVLLILILISVFTVVLESMVDIHSITGNKLRQLEWILTILFTIEYLFRLMAVAKPMQYVTSFYGIVDLLAILPTYLSLFITGSQSLLVIRALRLLRIFRILKLVQYVNEAKVLYNALWSSIRKIIIFIGAVLTLVLIIGAVMYLVEGEQKGFSSIPQSMYWAIVTMTTVGYGDVVPLTPLGKILASMVMITGYGIIAVPTGIVTVELSNAYKKVSTQSCPDCSAEGHDPDAKHCKFCGALLLNDP